MTPQSKKSSGGKKKAGKKKALPKATGGKAKAPSGGKKKAAVKSKTGKPGAVKSKPKKKPTPSKAKKKAAAKNLLIQEDEKRWKDLYKQYKDQPAAKYDKKETFAAGAALSHPDFGWGFILYATDNRLKVLFEKGEKKLISNQKSDG